MIYIAVVLGLVLTYLFTAKPRWTGITTIFVILLFGFGVPLGLIGATLKYPACGFLIPVSWVVCWVLIMKINRHTRLESEHHS